MGMVKLQYHVADVTVYRQLRWQKRKVDTFFGDRELNHESTTVSHESKTAWHSQKNLTNQPHRQTPRPSALPFSLFPRLVPRRGLGSVDGVEPSTSSAPVINKPAFAWFLEQRLN
jgi:hypothetical protein